MGTTPHSNSDAAGPYYDSHYEHFETPLYAQIRRDAFGDDIGQTSWLTASELDGLMAWLGLSAENTALDVACGSGGPALRIVARTGCRLVGIDLHEQAISIARSIAVQRQLNDRAEFLVGNAAERLPFPGASFDAITCIDAIHHFPSRALVIAEWARVLKPGGRLLFTDPVTITGPLATADIAVRSSTGFMVFAPDGYDAAVIAESGLRMLARSNATSNMADVAERRRAARATRSSRLREIEGDRTFELQQEFLEVAARIAREGRLSRFVYVAEKPGDAHTERNV